MLCSRASLVLRLIVLTGCGCAFDLACTVLYRDGTDENLVAGADGAIVCFSAQGTERWRHVLPALVLQVAEIRLDGNTPVVLAGNPRLREVAASPVFHETQLHAHVCPSGPDFRSAACR